MPWSETPSRLVTPRAARHAASLRRNPTDAERRLWWHLRHRLPMPGTHFRRQIAIESYVADFCCLGHRLIVELDGDQHGHEHRLAYDKRRTETLERRGYRVLRFPNHVVMREIDSVLDTIAAALSLGAPSGTTPTPNPSPQGGGE
ncbi:endonuclease domain-containing protein [Methylobacterium aerolatum]